MKYLLIGLLKAYRLLISPLYGDVCRYYPSCSAYALRAVGYHGAVKGSWFAALRLLRCHPWAAGGYDPVRGTPEFDEEMRDRASAQATMEKAPGVGSASEPTGDETAGLVPHRAGLWHRAVTVSPGPDRVVTVSQGRGGK